jgi:hypothetical protein
MKGDRGSTAAALLPHLKKRPEREVAGLLQKPRPHEPPEQGDGPGIPQPPEGQEGMEGVGDATANAESLRTV